MTQASPEIMSTFGKEKGMSQPYPLIGHMIDTAVVADWICSDYLPENVSNHDTGLGSLRDWVVAASMMHDLGKVNSGFQAKIVAQEDSACVTEKYAHSTMSGYLWWAISYARLRSTYGENKRFRDRHVAKGVQATSAFAEILASHHGYLSMRETLTEMRSSLKGPRNFVREHQPLATTHVESAEYILGAHFGIVLEPFLTEITAKPLLTWERLVIAGCVQFADWIASSIAVDSQLTFGGDYDEHVSRMKVLVAEQAPTIYVPASMRDGFNETFFNHALTFDTMMPIQESVKAGCDDGRIGSEGGMLVIAETMGRGKTETALLAAGHMGASQRGMYFALPTTGTADAMFTRLNKVAQASQPGSMMGLCHSGSVLNENYLTEEREDIWLEGGGKSLTRMFYPFAVGTIDQILLSTLSAHNNAPRLASIIGKVLIIDEVHTLDPYMLTLLGNVLNALGRMNSPVILMSATIPHHVVSMLVRRYTDTKESIPNIPYPGWLYVSADRQTINMEHVPASEDASVSVVMNHIDFHASPNPYEDIENFLDQAVKNVEHSGVIDGQGCGILYVNTVARAQQVYSRLTLKYPQTPIFLLHARMQKAQRTRVEENIKAWYGSKNFMDRPRKGLVIATQIAEASLDLDFDVMFSEMSPADSMIQRVGRLHRNPLREHRGGHDTPVFNVFVSHASGGHVVKPLPYQTYIVELSKDAIEGHDVLHLPQDTQGIVSKVYDRQETRSNPLLEDYLTWQKAQLHAASVSATVFQSVSMAQALPYVPPLLGEVQSLTHNGNDLAQATALEGSQSVLAHRESIASSSARPDASEAQERVHGTRYDLNSRTIVPVTVDGEAYIDASGQPVAFSTLPADKNKAIVRLLDSAINVSFYTEADWCHPVHDETRPTAEIKIPQRILKAPWLRDVIFLPMHKASDEHIYWVIELSAERIVLEPSTGLVKDRFITKVEDGIIS